MYLLHKHVTSCQKWPLIKIEVKTIKNNLLGPWKRYLPPLEKGDHLIQVSFTVIKGNDFWDFAKWPLNRRWSINRSLRNISLTVLSMKGSVYFVFPVYCRCTQCLSSLHPRIESWKFYKRYIHIVVPTKASLNCYQFVNYQSNDNLLKWVNLVIVFILKAEFPFVTCDQENNHTNMANLRLISWFYLPFEPIVLSPDPGHRRLQVSFELNPVFWG